MGVMVVLMRCVDRDDATSAGNRATHVLELYRGVMHVKAIAEHMVQFVQNVIALRGRHVVDQNMAAEGAGV